MIDLKDNIKIEDSTYNSFNDYYLIIQDNDLT